jgi:hypothetical protein
MGNTSGEAIGIGSATLRKRLHERGLLLSVEQDRSKLRLTVRQTIGGKRRQLLHVGALLSPPEFCAPSAPDAPIEEKHQEKQSDDSERGVEIRAPIQMPSAPSAPERRTLNGSRSRARLLRIAGS